VIRPDKAPEKTESGLILPEQAQEAPRRGTVVAVGPGGRDASGTLRPLDIHEGDTVVYTQYGGAEIEVDGEDVLILSARDVFAVL